MGLVRDLQLPVKLVGVGEKIDDLQDFNPPEFVDALLDLDPSAGRELQQRLGSTLSRFAVLLCFLSLFFFQCGCVGVLVRLILVEYISVR